eukprot:SAG11_NODE_4704_length_1797_cov_1.630742_2_plen_238_part_00
MVQQVQNGETFPWDPSESFGAACSQPSLLSNVSALLAAWRPGAEGGPALLNLLRGAVNPSAHLSVAWPRSVGGIGSQVPYLQQFALHYREQYQDEPTTPLFRFGEHKQLIRSIMWPTSDVPPRVHVNRPGYGLTYSNITTSVPRVASANVSATDTVDVVVDVNNHSPLAATAVVQLYFQQAIGGAAVIRYYSQLVRFVRVHVGAGATTTVTLPLKIADLAYWDNNVRANALVLCLRV